MLLGLALAGCSIKQLEDNTIDVGGSVGLIYRNQVLENINALIADPNSVPSHFSFKDGSIKTFNEVSPSVTVPLGPQITTNAQGAVVEAVNNYNGVTLGAKQQWEQTWNIEPEQDPTALRRLRALYRYVIGQQSAEQLQTEFVAVDADEVGEPPAASGVVPAERRVRAQLQQTLAALARNVDTCPIDARSGLAACLRWSRWTEACSRSDGSAPTIKAADGEWVCLGRFGGATDRFLRRRTLVLWRPAYDGGMIFDLVTAALQVQRDAAATGGDAGHR